VDNNPANQRKHVRISPLLIRADFSRGVGEKAHKAYVTNLSYGGAFLATREPLAIGSKLLLHITLPWEIGRLSVEAKVVWKREDAYTSEANPSSGAGLQFVALEKGSTEKLKKYFERFVELVGRLPDPVP
jgi:Tfp pilus assembly protein PilZ